MPANLGYQFAPGTDARGPQNQGQPQQGRGLSPQSAVRLLQLRVPERPAASAIAPQALLQSPGMGGLGGDGLAGIIKALAGRAVPPQMAPTPPAPSPMAPPPPMAPSPMAPPQPTTRVNAPPYYAPSEPTAPMSAPPYSAPSPASSAPPLPRVIVGLDEGAGGGMPTPTTDTSLPPQEDIDRILNTPVSGGQTLGNGGGFAGRWRDWIGGPPIESLF
jgi:hypothetical protein